MATDATGTPTSPDSIPTYNTAVDSPSGDGFNATMAVIQTALSARISKSLVTTTGDLIYASAASTPARLAAGAAGTVLTSGGAGVAPSWAAASGLPAGSIIQYGAASAPSGYLLCDGTAVSRTTYADLFAVVSTLYNTGGEAGTDFRLPDLRGRVPIGYAASGGHTDVATLGNNDGVAVANRRGKHNHTFTQPTISTPTITLSNLSWHDGGTTFSGLPSRIQITGFRTSSDGNPYTNSMANSLTASSSTPTASSGAAGVGGTAATDTPAYLIVNFIIKT